MTAALHTRHNHDLFDVFPNSIPRKGEERRRLTSDLRQSSREIFASLILPSRGPPGLDAGQTAFLGINIARTSGPSRWVGLLYMISFPVLVCLRPPGAVQSAALDLVHRLFCARQTHWLGTDELGATSSRV